MFIFDLVKVLGGSVNWRDVDCELSIIYIEKMNKKPIALLLILSLYISSSIITTNTANAETYYKISGKIILSGDISILSDYFERITIVGKTDSGSSSGDFQVSSDGNYSGIISENTSRLFLHLKPKDSYDEYIYSKNLEIKGNREINFLLPRIRVISVSLIDAQKVAFSEQYNLGSYSIRLGQRNFRMKGSENVSDLFEAGDISLHSKTGKFNVLAFQAEEFTNLNGSPAWSSWRNNILTISDSNGPGTTRTFFIDSTDKSNSKYTLCTPVNILPGQTFPSNDCESDSKVKSAIYSYDEKFINELKMWESKQNSAITPKKVVTNNKTSISCSKGKLIKIISGINPKCPSGYKLKV
ncbi:MAG: hypothetical protein WCJ43_04805 [Actinomycetes bacterium]